jgi:hypothetical protein
MSETLYKERDVNDLDMLGDFYTKNVKAMTLYGLHSKEDIAAELGYRDMLIAQLRQTLLHERAERAKETDHHEDMMGLAQDTLRSYGRGM